MKTASLLTLCAILFALGAAGARAVSYEYDRTAPLELAIDETRDEGTIRIDSISFRSVDRIVHAALVHPRDQHDRMPGVLFVAGPSASAPGKGNEFLADAEWLARRGAVSIVPDIAWPLAGSDGDTVPSVIELRRCLDALIATPGVDEHHLAYVGHDIGASYGALLASIDSRPSTFVFVAPARTAPFDMLAALARAALRGSFLQFGARDTSFPKDLARAFAAAVPDTDRTVSTYDADHALAIDAATDERRAWLAAHLGIR
jgi:dienelactone hydrolase